MNDVTTIGLDLAKHVFQVHGVDAIGDVVIRRQLRRSQVLTFFGGLDPCLVGMEACAGSHHWARELRALGHEVRIMPAHYVKPYVKRNKNDAADAAAIAEAVTRPSMRFVAVKEPQQQGLLMLHRTRALLVRQRTMLVNAIRAHLAEFGVVAPVGLRGLKTLLAVIDDGGEPSGHSEVAAARERVQAELGFVTFAEGLHQAIKGLGPHAEGSHLD